MANVLTGLIPTAYRALAVVSREMIGFITAASRNSGAERVALNQTITVPIAPAVTLADNTPGVTAPDTGDQTATTVEMTISRSKHAAIRWTGEETLAMRNGGTFDDFKQQQFEQAFRAIANGVEADLATIYTSASRAYGTAGVAPFGTAADFTDFAGVAKILDENGAPVGDRQLVLGSAAIANIRGKQSLLFKANEAGTDELLRRGIIGRVEGFDIHNSAQVKAHVKGTGTSYNSDLGGGYGIGATTVHVEVGTGTILAGDVGVWTGDANKYVVNTGFAGDGDGDIVLGRPGLRQTLANDVALTLGANYTANLAFSRSAVQLATRLPAMPDGGDMAVDRATITDPVSGLVFELAYYRQYRQVHIEIGLAWGWKVTQSEHVALLLG